MEENQTQQTVDMDLYSRQIGAFGLETMTRLIKLRVLVIGLRGLGVEICKNLILAGPKAVGIWDPRPCTIQDRSTNFYISKEHIEEGVSRAKACLPSLRELNPYVDITEDETIGFGGFCDERAIEDWDIVVCSEVFNYSETVLLNSMLRKKNKGFILASVQGLLGFGFVDFGPNHVIFDKNGEPCKSVLVSSITRDGIVTTQEDKRHDLENGDLISFSEVKGMESLNGKTFVVEDCPTPFTLKIKGIALELKPEEKYERNGILTEVKAKINPNFKAFQDSLLDVTPDEFPTPVDLDIEHMNRTVQLKFVLSKILRNQELFLKKTFQFRERKLNKHVDLLEQFLFSDEKIEESAITDWKTGFEPDLVKKCLSFWNCQIAPMCSFWGGVIAQEVVKFTGKFTPLNQWLIHEFYSTIYKGKTMEDLKDRFELAEKYADKTHRDQFVLFGEEAFQKMRDSKLFMVGAGALGCEYLKLFALLGIGTGDEGVITVTDDDTIENSNLNRQFLFRKQHIGQFKSETATEVAKQMNPSLNTKALTMRVEPATESEFTDEFFDSLTFIVNAVDNIKARQYVDSKAVLHQKWLFESGTLGTKCNSQMVIPGKTESYSDSKDPEETSVPMCTLRNFPFLIEHCIEWSREHFFSEFSSASRELALYLEKPDLYFEELKKEAKANAVGVTERIQGFQKLVDLAKEPTLANFICFMRADFDKSFDTSIQKLLRLFPEDFVDKNGRLFWSSPKRPPKAIAFLIEDESHYQYITKGVKILSQIFSETEIGEINEENIEQVFEDYQPEVEAGDADAEEEKRRLTDENASGNDQDLMGRIEQIEASLSEVSPDLKVNALEFEKDDDANGHIDFITLCSNLRAENYQIEKAPRHKIKLIAGKIIPAIATTTAMVVGAMGIEMMKFYCGCEFESFRDFFSNLGISLMTFSEPFPPKVTRDKEYDVVMMGPIKAVPPKWDTWARLTITGKGMTVKDLVKEISEKYDVIVESLAHGSFIFWTSYGMGEERYELVIEDIYKENIGNCYEGRKYFVLTAGAVDKDDVSILLPPVVYTIEEPVEEAVQNEEVVNEPEEKEEEVAEEKVEENVEEDNFEDKEEGKVDEKEKEPEEKEVENTEEIVEEKEDKNPKEDAKEKVEETFEAKSEEKEVENKQE